MNLLVLSDLGKSSFPLPPPENDGSACSSANSSRKLYKIKRSGTVSVTSLFHLGAMVLGVKVTSKGTRGGRILEDFIGT